MLISCKQAQVKDGKQASLITLLIILIVPPPPYVLPFLSAFGFHPPYYLFHRQNDLVLKVRETKPLQPNGESVV